MDTHHVATGKREKEREKERDGLYLYISRLRRNLSIHIARFSASESPRAYINTPKKSPFFAGSWHFANGDAPASATAHAPASHMVILSLLA